MMEFDRSNRGLVVVCLTFMIMWKLSSSIIQVDFVNGQQGLTVITVNEGSGFVSLLVTASEDVSFQVYPESFSTARVGEDYTIAQENYTLLTAETVVVFVNITDDNLVEAQEYIGIAFESNDSSHLQYLIFIQDNDKLSVAFFRDAYITSESRPANVCVRIIEGSIQRLQPISLTLITSPGSASPFDDYIPTRPVLLFTERHETGSILCTNITTVPDNPNAPVVENTEDYLVTFESNIEIEMLGSLNMTVYITDEDGAAVSIFSPLSASPEFQVNESDSDTTVRVYIRLSPPENVIFTLQRSVDVYLSTSLGTADDSDFVSVFNELITIQSNSTMASYDMTIRGDIIPESDEQFTFNISTVDPADQVVPPSQGTITILNDDEVPDCGVPPDPGVNGQVNFTTTIYLAEANYDCDVGYDLIPGIATRTCLLNRTWSGEDPICQIVDCGNLTSPLQGYVSIAESTFGSEANYSCFEGYELNGNVTRTCLDSGNWLGSEPICNLVDCGYLSPPSNGNVTLNSTLYQSLAYYYCSYGYNLIRNSSRYCQANGEWSGEEPTCEVVECGLLVAPLFGEVNITDTTFGSVANYSCQRGYSINGTSIRVCEGNGQWSDSMPQCIPADCGDLPAPSNGQVNIDNGTLYPTGEATYECNGGYELVGTAYRVCLSNGHWSGEEPSCRFLRCGSLPDPPNGQVSTNNPPVNGTLANYTCNNGFQLLGEPLRLCQITQWSGSPPECISIDCGNLTDPQNGTVTVSSTIFQSVADYRCDTGFVLNGTVSRTCQSDGIWSATQPLCQAVDCAELTDPPDGSVTLTASTTFGSIAEYRCSFGFILIGNLRRTCQANGQWSGLEPTCTTDPTLTGGNSANSNSEFVVTVVSASVGGFALAVLITIIVILAAIARIWRTRRETYSLATVSVTRHSHNRRLSQLVSPLHPGVFVPRSGLDHPLYDSVFANTGSTSELQDERSAETRLASVNNPAIMLESSSHEDIVHKADDTSSQDSTSTHDDQTAQLPLSSNVIYDNRSATRHQDIEPDISSDHPTSANNSLPDNEFFVFYHHKPTDQAS